MSKRKPSALEHAALPPSQAFFSNSDDPVAARRQHDAAASPPSPPPITPTGAPARITRPSAIGAAAGSGAIGSLVSQRGRKPEVAGEQLARDPAPSKITGRPLPGWVPPPTR